MLTPEEMAETIRLAEESYQEVMSRTQDREDDRVYQEQGAGALAMLRMSRDTATPTPSQYQKPPKK